MTPEKLRELEEKLETATQGKWSVYNSNSWRRIGLADQYRQILYPCNSSADGHPDIGGPNRDADLDEIVALHNAAPDLIAAARRLEALEEAMRELEKDGDAFEDAASIRHRADQILKERSK